MSARRWGIQSMMEIILLCFYWQVRLWLTESSGNLLKDICLHGKGTGYIIPFLKDACNLNGYLRNWGVLGDPYYSSSLKVKYSENKHQPFSLWGSPLLSLAPVPCMHQAVADLSPGGHQSRQRLWLPVFDLLFQESIFTKTPLFTLSFPWFWW